MGGRCALSSSATGWWCALAAAGSCPPPPRPQKVQGFLPLATSAFRANRFVVFLPSLGVFLAPKTQFPYAHHKQLLRVAVKGDEALWAPSRWKPHRCGRLKFRRGGLADFLFRTWVDIVSDWHVKQMVDEGVVTPVSNCEMD